MDIGSGGGLPGLVLAIATDLEFTLVESNRRKAAFLLEAARITGTTVKVAASRLKYLDTRVDLITARAVAPLPRLLEMAFPHLHQDGTCLFPKGASIAAELKESARAWQFEVEHFPSVTNSEATILRVANLRPR